MCYSTLEYVFHRYMALYKCFIIIYYYSIRSNTRPGRLPKSFEVGPY